MRGGQRGGAANTALPPSTVPYPVAALPTPFPPASRGGYRRTGALEPRAATSGTDALHLALVLVVWLSIGRMHQHYSIIAAFRPALVLVGVAFALALLQPRYLNRSPLLATWPAKMVAAIAVMALISAPFGISLGNSVMFIISDFSKTLVLCFLVVAATRHARDLMAFSWAYLLGCAFLVYLSLFFFHTVSIAGGLSRLSNLYMYDANDIGLILVIGMGLAALFAQAYTGTRRYAAILVMLGMGAAIARSGSRGGFLGLLVVGGALLVALNRVSVLKRVAFVGLVGLGLALYAPAGYWDQMGTILNPTEDYNWSAQDGRRQIWSRGLGYMAQYPIAGIGIHNFERAECTISEKAQNHVEGTGLTCTAPHNSYVQIGAELGIPGLILWVVMIFGGILKMRSLARRVPHYWEYGDLEARFLYHAPRHLTICMLGFAATSFFVSHAYLDPVYLLMALMAGTYLAAADRMRRDQAAVQSALITPSLP